MGVLPAIFSLVVFAIVSAWGWLFQCDSGNSPCGSPAIQPRNPRIVGGDETQPGSLPWMAVLSTCGSFTCGGAILNRQFILTAAAHCIHEPEDDDCDTMSPSNWIVYLNKHHVQKTDPGEVHMQVEGIFLHPKYDNVTHVNDIALLKLTGKIVYSSHISPVCLPLASQTPHDGQSCIVAGFGETLSFDRFSLHHVTVPIVSDQQCLQPDWYGAENMFSPPAQICAGIEEGGKDSCYGDSGSPLICKIDGKWLASGIVSIGQRCGLPKQPGIYTNVSHYELWIRTTMSHNAILDPCELIG